MTTRKSTALAAFSIHAFLLDGSAMYRRCLGVKGMDFVDFMPGKPDTWMESELSDGGMGEFEKHSV